MNWRLDKLQLRLLDPLLLLKTARSSNPRPMTMKQTDQQSATRSIISKGRVRTVSEAELDELRASKVSWFAYCQKRLTLGHAEAVSALIS